MLDSLLAELCPFSYLYQNSGWSISQEPYLLGRWGSNIYKIDRHKILTDLYFFFLVCHVATALCPSQNPGIPNELGCSYLA